MNKAINLRLAYIIGTYPLLTTTFIDREIETMRELGVCAKVFSIRQPHGTLSTYQETIREDVDYLLPLSARSFIAGNFYFVFRRPKPYLSTLLFLVTRPHRGIRARFKTLLHFAEGVHTAHLMRQSSYDHVHAHFADRATTVAMVVSRLLNLEYSFTAHASDIYINPVLLPEKMTRAKFVATCTGYNESYLKGLINGHSDISIKRIYHGLDAGKYEKEGEAAESRPVVLAVGQLKEKKGFSYLLKACRLLMDLGYDLACHIVGGGQLQATLEAEIQRLSLQETVSLRGALPHQEVIDEYRQATMFVLPAVISQDGGRDGIPNVILEAMAMEIPVISTQHSGIPEVVENDVNGLLVPPADEQALAQAMAKLLDDPPLREQLGQNGRQTVLNNFDIEQNARTLLNEMLA
jgi:glycosyltransferase involved in cell wall biosynthesis